MHCRSGNIYLAIVVLLLIVVVEAIMDGKRPKNGAFTAAAAPSTPVPGTGGSRRPMGPPLAGPGAPRRSDGVTGAPAIRPHLAPSGNTTPSFNAQDVVAYVKANGVGGKIDSSVPATVEKVEFLSARVASTRLHTWIGVQDDALLCLVTVRGSFSITPPGGGRRAGSNVAFLVFDAHTGNILILSMGTMTPMKGSAGGS